MAADAAPFAYLVRAVEYCRAAFPATLLPVAPDCTVLVSGAFLGLSVAAVASVTAADNRLTVRKARVCPHHTHALWPNHIAQTHTHTPHTTGPRRPAHSAPAHSHGRRLGGSGRHRRRGRACGRRHPRGRGRHGGVRAARVSRTPPRHSSRADRPQHCREVGCLCSSPTTFSFSLCVCDAVLAQEAEKFNGELQRKVLELEQRLAKQKKSLCRPFSGLLFPSHRTSWMSTQRCGRSRRSTRTRTTSKRQSASEVVLLLPREHLSSLSFLSLKTKEQKKHTLSD